MYLAAGFRTILRYNSARRPLGYLGNNSPQNPPNAPAENRRERSINCGGVAVLAAANASISSFCSRRPMGDARRLA